MDDIGLIFHRTLVGGSKCHHRYKWPIAVLGILQRARCGGFVAEAPLKSPDGLRLKSLTPRGSQSARLFIFIRLAAIRRRDGGLFLTRQ